MRAAPEDRAGATTLNGLATTEVPEIAAVLGAPAAAAVAARVSTTAVLGASARSGAAARHVSTSDSPASLVQAERTATLVQAASVQAQAVKPRRSTPTPMAVVAAVAAV